MDVIDTPSPNFDGREGHIVDMLVLHYTGMPSAEAALSRLRDPQAKVSAHYVVEENGRIHRLVGENMRAWHAGVSHWRGHSNINQRSIGIEIVNPGHEFGYRPFPPAQMEAVAELCQGILARHPIPARNVVGHSDVAPARKEDPGELFDWPWLAGQGVGLWPGVLSDMPVSELLTVRERLSRYGYETGAADGGMVKTILAFQRHFRPRALSGAWDGECEAILAALLKNL